MILIYILKLMFKENYFLLSNIDRNSIIDSTPSKEMIHIVEILLKNENNFH